MDKILSKIYEQVQWYNHAGLKTQSITDLLNCKDKLAIYSYGLAQFASDLKAEYNTAYFIRKIDVAKQKQGLIANKKMSHAAAEVDAMVSTERQMQNELDKEAGSYKADLLLRQVNVIIQAITQRIAYLRSELDLTYKQQTT